MGRSNQHTVNGQASFQELCITKKGKLSARLAAENYNGFIPFIKASNILHGAIQNADAAINEAVVLAQGGEIVPKNSLLIVQSGPNAGNMALTQTETVVDNKILYATCKNEAIIPGYLFYYMLSKKDDIIRLQNRNINIPFSLLTNLAVPVPPVDIQQEIAVGLRNALEPCIAVTAQLQQQIMLLEQELKKNVEPFFNAIVYPASEAADKDAPANFKRLADCGIIKPGKYPSGSVKQYFGHDFPLFSPACLNQEMNICNSKIWLSQRGMQEAKGFDAGTVLICCKGPLLGKAGIARVRGACNAQLISITVAEGLLPEYLYYQVNWAGFHAQLMQVAADDKIGKQQLGNLLVYVPPLHQQRRVLHALITSTTSLHKKIQALKMQLEEQEQLAKQIFLQFFP